LLICTAAGREGINLQFARVLFNHDLPWNPMDVEQRIGRIHRYGQTHTAQVYNLVSADTIEGKIFLLLEEKLLEIGRALGKVDEFGQITEDLRAQVLGQLSERLSYDRLYQEAVRDPTLVRTRQELEVAVENAQTARQVVWELFQDLEGFRLDDYRQFDDGGQGMRRLVHYFRTGIREGGGQVEEAGPSRLRVRWNGDPEWLITMDRDEAMNDERLTLLGLEHPLVRQLSERHRSLGAERRGLAGRLPDGSKLRGVMTVWHVQVHGSGGRYHQRIITLGIDENGQRSRELERLDERWNELEAARTGVFDAGDRHRLATSVLPELLRRELTYQGILTDDASFSSRLLAWVEIA
jgi:hypothetical protein